MRNEHTRCQFIDPNGQQCEEWFQVDGLKYCPQIHRTLPSVEKGTISKESYLTVVNNEGEQCYAMTMPQLSEHIRDLERQKAEFLASMTPRILRAKQVEADRKEKMTEEERQELRKIKVHREVKRVKIKTATDKPKRQPKFQMSAEDLELSFEELQAKYERASDQRPNNQPTNQPDKEIQIR